MLRSFRAQDRHTQNGFTIVELLIVIVVIAILAAITIVAYNGVQQRAAEAVMKGDLRNATSLVETDAATTGTYAASLTTVNNGAGVTPSSGNSLQYTAAGSTFCISVTRAGMAPYKFDRAVGRIEDGLCTGHGIAIVTTLAGSTDGWNDATGTAAQFNSSDGVAVAPDGSIYVAETWGNRVRKITPAGVVTTIAGSTTGASGQTNAQGTAARFNGPEDVTIDSSGNIYVADRGNHVIRRIETTNNNNVTTWAGTMGVSGSANLNGTSASFNSPIGVAVDGSGNIYVADRLNHRIRKIDSARNVTTWAGSTQGYTTNVVGVAAQFNNPYDVAVDAAGVVYVADATNHRIRKIATDQTVTDIAGSTSGYVDGTGAAARFNTPTGVAATSSGSFIYVADQNNHRIRKVTSAGVVTTFAGSTAGANNGVGSSAQFYYPFRLGIAPDDSTVYVADSLNYRIRKLTQ